MKSLSLFGLSIAVLLLAFFTGDWALPTIGAGIFIFLAAAVVNHFEHTDAKASRRSR